MAAASGTDLDRIDLGDAVLILGAGLAGLYTALKLAPRRAVVMTPRPLGRGATSAWAQGGLAAAIGPDDSPADHLADTIAAGAGLVDEAAARMMTQAAPEAVEAIARLGVPLDRDASGAYALGLEAAHSRNRIVHVAGDQAGAAIMEAVIAAVRRAGHIDLMEGFAAEDILLSDDMGKSRACGVLAAQVDAVRRVRVVAGEIIIATGGAGGLFRVTTNPRGALGQGFAMAARAGAELGDLEFVQFHPTAMDIGVDPAPLATEALRGAGARLVDRNGRPFMEAAHELGDLAPRDVVARAVAAQRRGDGAYLDARSAIGAEFETRFPAVYAACTNAGIDPARDVIPVAPAAHYHMGGIRTDMDGRTTRDGLWACGETACTGAHGANRLASNSLLEAVVFGDRIATAIRNMPARSPAGPAPPPADRIAAAPKPARGDALQRLRDTMARGVGILRSAESITTAIDEIDVLKREADRSSGMLSALLSAELIARAALARRESRGAHFRTDFPQADDDWRRRIPSGDFFSDRKADMAETAIHNENAPDLNPKTVNAS